MAQEIKEIEEYCPTCGAEFDAASDDEAREALVAQHAEKYKHTNTAYGFRYFTFRNRETGAVKRFGAAIDLDLHRMLEHGENPQQDFVDIVLDNGRTWVPMTRDEAEAFNMTDEDYESVVIEYVDGKGERPESWEVFLHIYKQRCEEATTMSWLG